MFPMIPAFLLTVALLGSEDFEARERAEEALKRSLPQNLVTLRKIRNTSEDPEIRVRLGRILRAYDRFRYRDWASFRAHAIQVLETSTLVATAVATADAILSQVTSADLQSSEDFRKAIEAKGWRAQLHPWGNDWGVYVYVGKFVFTVEGLRGPAPKPTFKFSDGVDLGAGIRALHPLVAEEVLSPSGHVMKAESVRRFSVNGRVEPIRDERNRPALAITFLRGPHRHDDDRAGLISDWLNEAFPENGLAETASLPPLRLPAKLWRPADPGARKK